jgi:hypothetical protein
VPDVAESGHLDAFKRPTDEVQVEEERKRPDLVGLSFAPWAISVDVVLHSYAEEIYSNRGTIAPVKSFEVRREGHTSTAPDDLTATRMRAFAHPRSSVSSAAYLPERFSFRVIGATW